MSKPIEVFRKDYRPTAFSILDVYLEFDLFEDFATVKSRLKIEKKEESELVLKGEDLELKSVKIDGRVLGEAEYSVADKSLSIFKLPDSFELETVVRTKPQENFELSGLYKSTGNFCTQCEAEGFRRITYFLDRPDVMARYETKIIADKALYPVLLSNGNRIDQGEAENGRHWALWEDPFLKPCYLFAMVAANLTCHKDVFTTRSGREVALELWVNDFDAGKTDHAMEALKKSMLWDEERYGLEYDLDIYMVVAVPDFNMGAMENKGLNIFNTKYVLANPQTANDADYEGIDEVIAHEYFHNWTGNRVTCRDWFQLTLKEGLTVFRDQQFTADQTSAAVKRIKDVQGLRAAQFAEDAGPMSHPIRPDSYIVMDNFYTNTVYRKGAEIIRMYHTLLGEDGFRKGMDLYFQRFDGQAVTCDDFRIAMAEANDRDLTQFERWYDQNGTPEVFVSEKYNADAQTLTLDLEQRSGATLEHLPFHMPIRVGLVSSDGSDMTVGHEGVRADEHLLELKNKKETIVFDGVEERPVVSLLRGFSAPIKVKWERPLSDYSFLQTNDSDPFNRWDAGQSLSKSIILAGANNLISNGSFEVDDLLVNSIGSVLRDTSIDGMYKAYAMKLPSINELVYELPVADPDIVSTVREAYVKKIAEANREDMLAVYRELNVYPTYEYSPDEVNRRSLKNSILGYLSSIGDQSIIDVVFDQFNEANNMTDQGAALMALCDIECTEREDALAAFYDRWKDEALVVDKWFSMQAASSASDTFERVLELSKHQDFNVKNPNRVRSLLGFFTRLNLVHFHRADGAGYEFLADHVLKVEGNNGQLGAALVSAFNSWRKFSLERQGMMRSQLERIVAKKDLSGDVYEIVSRALA